MLPFQGPSLLSIPEFQGLLVPAATTLARVELSWDVPRFVTGLRLIPRSGDPADSARLELAIETISNGSSARQFVGDGGTGLATGNRVPGCALNGIGFRPFALQKPIDSGDTWWLTVTNVDAAVPVTIAALLLDLEQPGR